MFELKKWKLEKTGKQIIGWGRCYGNPRFSEGCYIRTSYIAKAEILEEQEQILLTTYSGSRYALPFAGFDEEQWETTAELVKALGLELDSRRCVQLKEQAEEGKKKWLEDLLQPCEIYVKIDESLMAQEVYYRTEQGEIIKMAAGCHTGMFIDSVLIGYGGFFRKCPCGWRYMIDGGGRITCYFWDGSLDAVRIHNEGRDFIVENGGREILCKGNEITVIERV